MQWRTVLRRVTAQIWFRLVLFTVAALGVVVVALSLGPHLPDALTWEFGQDSVASILQILATSMLAVTTFSLTAMISAYSAAAQATTPRATQLLIEDPTSQNALSTFLGAFVFSIVGVIALSAGSVTEKARSVVFLATLVVIAVVVGTLLRWIHHLTRFGRVPDIIDRVERAATDTAKAFAREPHLGGAAPETVPEGAHVLRAAHAGCVTGVSLEGIQAWADRADARVHVDVLPGVTVGCGGVLAHVVRARPVERSDEEELREAFLVEAHRTYEQDPRLGFVALAEIGSRALSPSTNDPGTAIEALNAIERVMTTMFTTQPVEETRFARVHMARPALEDIIEDALRPVARDGAPLVEVGLRVQRVLRHVMAVAPEEACEVLREASQRAEDRAVAALTFAGDRELVQTAARETRS